MSLSSDTDVRKHMRLADMRRNILWESSFRYGSHVTRFRTSEWEKWSEGMVNSGSGQAPGGVMRTGQLCIDGSRVANIAYDH